MFDATLLAALRGEFAKLAASKGRMTIPQSRSGRRSMTVDTMLKKDREGTLFKKEGLTSIHNPEGVP